LRSSSGSLAMFAAIRRASSLLSNLAAENEVYSFPQFEQVIAVQHSKQFNGPHRVDLCMTGICDRFLPVDNLWTTLWIKEGPIH
jgi:hypothetical protein